MKKTVFSILACLLLLLVMGRPLFAQSFKPGSEPKGFGDLTWGTEASKIAGMEYSKDAPIGGSCPEDLAGQAGEDALGVIKIYKRTGDKLNFAGTPVRSIQYGFCGGKLCEVTMVIRGSNNWGTLKEAVFDRYGKVKLQSSEGMHPEQLMNELEYYIWVGQTSEMDMVYNPASGIGELWFGSTEIRNRVFEEARKEINKSAPPAPAK